MLLTTGLLDDVIEAVPVYELITDKVVRGDIVWFGECDSSVTPNNK